MHEMRMGGKLFDRFRVRFTNAMFVTRILLMLSQTFLRISIKRSLAITGSRF